MNKANTSGRNKLENYFKELLIKQSFKDDITKLKETLDTAEFNEYVKENEELCVKYNLPPYPFGDVVHAVVVEDDWESVINTSNPSFDMCTVRSLTVEEDGDPDAVKALNKAFPVAISISPYAKIEDIKAFLNEHKDFIREFLESHQSSENVIAGFKRRNAIVAARDAFIYENRDIPTKELVTAVSEKYGTVMGYDEVRKAITREKKRRK